MNNAERMLALVREQFARDCQMDTYIERHYNRIREMEEKNRATGMWDEAELEQEYVAYWAAWCRHEETRDLSYAELTRLREASLDELMPGQHDEIRELLKGSWAIWERRKKEAETLAERARRRAATP